MNIRIFTAMGLMMTLPLFLQGQALPLIPCPDCAKPVSRRALMCPNCGCRGEVIETYSAALTMPIVGDVLDCDCDGVRMSALPVEFERRRFVLLPLDPVLGAARIRLFKAGTTDEVAWHVPELAEDAPVVRLSLADTNLVCWTIGGSFAFDGSNPGNVENKVSAVVSGLGGVTTNRIDGHQWRILQPRQMRVHGKALKRILKGEPADLPESAPAFFKKLESEMKGRRP